MNIVGIQPQKVENINLLTKSTIGEPLGLARILAIAEGKGHDIKYIPYIYSVDATIEEIQKFSPDLILFSMMTSQYQLGKLISERIKTIYPDVPIIAGGYHPSSKVSIEKPFDIYVKGEGENTFTQLLQYFEIHNDKFKLKDIQGIAFLDSTGKEIITNAPNRIFDIDMYPIPIRTTETFTQKYYGLIYPNYQYQTGFAYVEYGRGCHNNCEFCCKDSIYSGKDIFFRNPQNVVKELQLLMEQDVNLFFFTDLNFTVSRKHVYSLCNEIIKQGLKISWFCMSNIDTIRDYDMLKIMQQAGCVKIMYGVESVSPKLKNVTNKKNHNTYEVMRQTASVGILCHMFYVIGFPWEMPNDIIDSINEIIEIPAHQIRIGVATPLPGSMWFNEMKDNSLLPDWNLYDTENLVYKNHNFSNIEILIKTISSRFYTSEKYSTRVQDFLEKSPEYTNSFNLFLKLLHERGILNDNEFEQVLINKKQLYEI